MYTSIFRGDIEDVLLFKIDIRPSLGICNCGKLGIGRVTQGTHPSLP